jgi:hypothetical protein
MSSPEEATQTMIANYPEKTGKTLDEWVAIARASGLAKHREILNLMKDKYGMTYGYANLVAIKTLEGAAPPASDDLVEMQYSGDKAGLRPIYAALIAAVSGFGSDVEAAPKKAYVSLRRRKQFAIIQPSTAARVDVGINLKGIAAGGRLEASGSFNTMVSHRVRLSALDEVDGELLAWLKQAYDQA